MGIDDDLGAAEGTRRLLRELEKNGAVALPLQVVADADLALTPSAIASLERQAYKPNQSPHHLR